jgi:hypothetical protein
MIKLPKDFKAPGNDSKKNRAATSGISVDSAPKLRQNFKNNSQCTLYQNSVLSATRIPHPSTIRTTRGFGCSATMCSLPSLMIPTPPPRIVHFFRNLTDKQEICVTKQRWAEK